MNGGVAGFCQISCNIGLESSRLPQEQSAFGFVDWTQAFDLRLSFVNGEDKFLDIHRLVISRGETLLQKRHDSIKVDSRTTGRNPQVSYPM